MRVGGQAAEGQSDVPVGDGVREGEGTKGEGKIENPPCRSRAGISGEITHRMGVCGYADGRVELVRSTYGSGSGRRISLA